MHIECMGTHRKSREHTVAHGSTREIIIMSDISYHEHLINAQTSKQVPCSVVVAAVLFFVMLLQRLFE